MLDRRDGLIAMTLALLLGVASYALAQLIPPLALTGRDIWFESDSPRVALNMMSVDSNHHRTSVHPLFSLMAFPPVYLLRKLLSIEPATAVLIVSATVASLWIAALFSVLRLIGCRRLDSTLFSVLGGVSAAAFFWLPVPETFTWGSLTILVAFWFLAVAESRTVGAVWHVVVSALTMSATLTNWMVGILTSLVTQHWKRALQLTVNAFCVVVLFWGIQKALFPSAQFLLVNQKDPETKWIMHPQAGGPLHVVQSFFFHTMVTPSVKFVEDTSFVFVGTERVHTGHRLGTQFSAPGSASAFGLAAAGLWFTLLVLGFIALFKIKPHRPLRIVLGLTILGQLGLHLVYGEETFLYSMHFAPLLILLTALGTLTPMRRAVLVLAGFLVLFAGVNNWRQFVQACELASPFTAQRLTVQSRMERDPVRPWPRGLGHVVLAEPGSAELDKSYHEPGGNFSPRFGSFGASLWLIDRQGTPVITSETLPLDKIRQAFRPAADAGIPEVVTTTPYYETVWSFDGSGRWTLHLNNRSPQTPVLVIRSVGPAGGPVKSLQWDGHRLLINERWILTITPEPTSVYLGDETEPTWMYERVSTKEWSNKSGWGYARIELGRQLRHSNAPWTVNIEDSRIHIPRPAWLFSGTPLSIQGDLPDPRFLESLRAQGDHLRMGLVEHETRPGDPAAYLSSSIRDGAYVVVALARAGQHRLAKLLALKLAEQDLSQGFPEEADGPGLGIWALADVARQLEDSYHYDRWIWTHVRRKADRIVRMLKTEEPIMATGTRPTGGLLNGSFEQWFTMTPVALPARDGMIVGRVGADWPMLYVNAVSYRALLDAAELAARLGEYADAAAWQTQAFALRYAWETAFTTKAAPDELSSGVGLWPSMIAESVAPQFLQHLGSKRPRRATPQSPSLDSLPPGAGELAEAHQWLRLGDPEHVWATVRSFLDHQSSPGLYTWSTTNGNPSTAGLWEYVRGWTAAAPATPDYRTAAELLLLQLEMLTYVDDMATEPTVVIGAGIPSIWLSQPMRVSHFPLPQGTIDWSWDGRRMQVTMHGKPMKVQLGPSFPQTDIVDLKVDSTSAPIVARQ